MAFQKMPTVSEKRRSRSRSKMVSCPFNVQLSLSWPMHEVSLIGDCRRGHFGFFCWGPHSLWGPSWDLLTSLASKVFTCQISGWESTVLTSRLSVASLASRWTRAVTRHTLGVGGEFVASHALSVLSAEEAAAARKGAASYLKFVMSKRNVDERLQAAL